MEGLSKMAQCCSKRLALSRVCVDYQSETSKIRAKLLKLKGKEEVRDRERKGEELTYRVFLMFRGREVISSCDAQQQSEKDINTDKMLCTSNMMLFKRRDDVFQSPSFVGDRRRDQESVVVVG